MKHFEDKEMCQFKIDQENQVWCRKEDCKFNVCGSCQSCLCMNKLDETTRWLSCAGVASKWKFLIGVLVRCKSVDILENTQTIVQVTLGKDFTYARSRQKRRVPDTLTTWSSEKAIDEKCLETEMLETWDWFSVSKHWVRASYILGLLSLCDTELLHALGNLIGVLITKERRSSFRGSASHCSFSPEDRAELDLLHHTGSRSCSLMLDSLCDILGQDSVKILQEKCFHSAAEPHLPEETPWAGLETLGRRGVVKDERSRGGMMGALSPEDLTLAVIPGSSVSLSGVSCHRDFIRRLPVHLAKKILGLLDRATLLRCCRVSQHWCFLAEEVQAEIITKRMVENQAMIMQGSSTVSVSAVYSKVREVLVPTSEKPTGNVVSDVGRDRGFESAYASLRTTTVEMQERNVFCGAYNILVLSSREDSARVVHFCGGQLVAVGSRDRMVRLLDVKAMRERSLMMQGHAGSIRTVHLCEDRDLVISAGYDLCIRCWSLRTGVCTMLLRGHFGTINCLDLHGNTLVSGAKDCRVKVWNLTTGKSHSRLRFKHDSPVLSVRVGQGRVLSGCDRGLLKLWDLETGGLLKLIDTPQGSVKCLYLDKWHVLSGGADGYVMAWSTSPDHAGSLMTYRHPREVLTLAFLFLRVITGCADGKVRVFDFLSGQCLRVIISNSQQSPVLSLHIHNNSMVINTKPSVLLFQFGEDFGEGEQEAEVPQDLPRGSSYQEDPCSPVRANSMVEMGSSSLRKCHGSLKQTERDSISHHAHGLFTPSMQQTTSAQQGTLRPATASGTQGYIQSWTSADLQLDTNTKPHSALCPGRVTSRPSHRLRTTTSSSARQPVAQTKWGFSCGEGTVRKQTREPGPCHPINSKHAPLVEKVSQQPLRCNRSRCSIHPNVGVAEAWRSSPVSPPQGQPGTGISLTSATAASSSASSPPHCSPSRRRIGSCSLSPAVGRPHTVQGFWSPHLHPSCCPQIGGTPPVFGPYGMGSGKTVHRVGAFTTTAERDICPDRRILVSAHCGRPGRHVGFDIPPNPETGVQQGDPFDPFRKRSLFQLLTAGQLEEREQEAVREHEQARSRERHLEEKQRRRAWRMRAKGLPGAHCWKEDQVHAPEMGQGTYI